MVRIDQFFGKAAVQKSKAQTKRKPAEPTRSVPAKKQKVDLPQDTTPKFFDKSKDTTPKPDQEIIDLDSDDDIEVKPRRRAEAGPSIKLDSSDDEEEPKKAATLIKSDPEVVTEKLSKAKPSTPRKKKSIPIASSPLKSSPTEQSASKTSTQNAAPSGATAQEILDTIPDADPSFLSVDPETEGMSYFQLKAKSSSAPVPSGNRVIPEGRPNCLNGLTIVFTGVLPTIDRDECVRIASKYGAKVTKSISGKTSLVVIGSDAGPKKIKTIKEKKIKCIDEDGFVELLTRMPPDGGSGAAAQAALAKREEDEKKALEQAKLEQEEERQRQLKIEKARQADPSLPERPRDKPDSEKLWTVKYAPTDLKQICGNKSNVDMLYRWLDHWFDNYKRGFKGSGIDGFRAVLISGPPGIGKTTAAHLIAKSLGYDIIEKNASDVRSKKLLNEQLKSSLNNSSVAGFFNPEKKHEKNNRKIVMIMDEVDGMSSGDHGGGAQLSLFCKTTSTPLILICNDKSLPKMRTFDKTCFDLTWRRPTSKEMKSRLMTISLREGLTLDPNIIDQLVAATGNDIRQIINIMSTVARTQKRLDYSNSESISKTWQKEVVLKPFDIVGRLLSNASYGKNSRYNINEKINLYFNDMDFTPLMIHENYRSTTPSKLVTSPPSKRNLAHLELLDKAADSISQSDLVSQLIRGSEQQWSLAPFHAVTSSILPGSYVCGSFSGRTMFTSWLGQNSKRMKYDRILQELQYHSSTKTMTNNQELRLSYIPFLTKILSEPLVQKGSAGIDEVLEKMDEYYVTKDDWDNLMEFGVGPRGRMDAKLKSIPTATKTAFTRKYNSYTHPTVIYKTGDSVTKGTRTAPARSNLDDVIDDDATKGQANGSGDEEEEEDIKKDKLIKQVKATKKRTSKRK